MPEELSDELVTLAAFVVSAAVTGAAVTGGTGLSNTNTYVLCSSPLVTTNGIMVLMPLNCTIFSFPPFIETVASLYLAPGAMVTVVILLATAK